MVKHYNNEGTTDADSFNPKEGYTGGSKLDMLSEEPGEGD